MFVIKVMLLFVINFNMLYNIESIGKLFVHNFLDIIFCIEDFPEEQIILKEKYSYHKVKRKKLEQPKMNSLFCVLLNILVTC